jgi:putative nucleotidyltransferase with HDIG domain
MERVMIVADTGNIADGLRQRLPQSVVIERAHTADLPGSGPGAMTVVDVDLRNRMTVERLKPWLRGGVVQGQVAICVNRRSSLEPIQAYALGATCLLPRPINPDLIAEKIRRGAGKICQGPTQTADEFFECISAGVDALQSAFAAAISGDPPDMRSLDAASCIVTEKIEDVGLKRWLEIVHGHHSHTYKHCLIVTGVAVSFGQFLGFNRADQQRLATAGLLHDIGKARIPIEILEKPSALTAEEMAIMRTHPETGYEALCKFPDVQPELLDIVLHHHEYLDGSGYPHGLLAPDISDLVRTITIADIYGALIERRTYKPAMSGAEAYRILEDMDAKLDRDLVREFGPLAHGIV